MDREALKRLESLAHRLVAELPAGRLRDVAMEVRQIGADLRRSLDIADSQGKPAPKAAESKRKTGKGA